MEKGALLENLKILGLNVQKISELTGIPDGRIYKWYKGTGTPKLDDFKKLQELYERLKPTPTNDFMGKGINNLAAEEQSNYLTAQQQITLLLQNNAMQAEKIKQLEAELEKRKTPVVRVGKTGGRRNSS